MQAKELRDMTDEKLSERLSDERKELFNLRFQLATGQLENTQRVPLVKKNIARILTVMGEKKRSQK